MIKKTDEQLMDGYTKYIGKKYAMLEITGLTLDKRISRKINREYRNVIAFCKCDCGNEVSIRIVSVVKGASRSCGCLSRTQKGLSASPIYLDWKMKRQHQSLGVCPEWEDFKKYHAWALANKFEADCRVYRYDEALPCSPENCYIDKRKEKKQKLKYFFHLVSPDGEEYIASSLSDFCIEHGLNPHMMHRVVRERESSYREGYHHMTHDGWTVDRMLRKEPTRPLYEDHFFYPYTSIV